MPTITKLGVDHRVRLGSTPWGNRTALRYPLQTNSAGAVVNGDSTAAVASGDVVRIGLIPAGFRIHDSQVVIATAMTALVTGNLGFQYADGVDDANVPQSATAFGTALALNTAGRLRNATTNKSVVLPKDAWLILTTGGANNAKVSDIEITLEATAEGV
jgi:hypothetical protein